MSAPPQMPWEKYGGKAGSTPAPWEKYGAQPELNNKLNTPEQDQSIPARFMRGAGEGLMQLGNAIAHPLDTLTAMTPHNETPGPGYAHPIWTPEGRQERMDELKTTPVLGPMLQGDFARGFGQGVPGAALALATHQAPKIAASPFGQAVGAGMRAGGRDVGMGLLKTAAAPAVHGAAEAVGIPSGVLNGVMTGADMAGALKGLPQVGRGLKRGIAAGKAEFNAPRPGPAQGLEPMDQPQPADMPSTAEEIARHPGWANIVKKPMDLQSAKPMIPSSGARPVIPDSFHISTDLPRVEPFASPRHKSPATVARQLEGVGTLAEGQAPAAKPPTSAFTNESIPADRRIKALGIAEQLRKLQGGE